MLKRKKQEKEMETVRVQELSRTELKYDQGKEMRPR